MSQPNRFHFDSENGQLVEAGLGEWVRHSDYAALVQQGIRDHADWRSKLNFLEADYKAEIARLTAENERLKTSQLSLEKWIACEQDHFDTADNLREKLYQASLEVERLRKALSDIEAAWIAKRAMDIIYIINKTKDTNAN